MFSFFMSAPLYIFVHTQCSKKLQGPCHICSQINECLHLTKKESALELKISLQRPMSDPVTRKMPPPLRNSSAVRWGERFQINLLFFLVFILLNCVLLCQQSIYCVDRGIVLEGKRSEFFLITVLNLSHFPVPGSTSSSMGSRRILVSPEGETTNHNGYLD